MFNNFKNHQKTRYSGGIFRVRQPPASITLCSGNGDLPLSEAIRDAILLGKPPGIWRMSVDTSKSGALERFSRRPRTPFPRGDGDLPLPKRVRSAMLAQNRWYLGECRFQ
jgi:hypothetical protein